MENYCFGGLFCFGTQDTELANGTGHAGPVAQLLFDGQRLPVAAFDGGRRFIPILTEPVELPPYAKVRQPLDLTDRKTYDANIDTLAQAVRRAWTSTKSTHSIGLDPRM